MITGGPSKKGQPLPFVTSTIGIGRKGQHQSFREIAKAGGGAFALMDGAGSDPAASQTIVRHILTLAFGSRFRAEMNSFIDVYYEFRREKLFK